MRFAFNISSRHDSRILQFFSVPVINLLHLHNVLAHHILTLASMLKIWTGTSVMLFLFLVGHSIDLPSGTGNVILHSGV